MITVLAGVNGAGKSTLLGTNLRDNNINYFNPDEVARQLMINEPDLIPMEANSRAWRIGKGFLERAIAANSDYVFESTLGGNTISGLLMEAAKNGTEISIFYCGLESPELHIKRVKERVAMGGHDIPEIKIRERWIGSLENMMRLMMVCKSISVFDNSTPVTEGKPKPRRLFAFSDNQWINQPAKDMPSWAKPLATTAMKRLSIR